MQPILMILPLRIFPDIREKLVLWLSIQFLTSLHLNKSKILHFEDNDFGRIFVTVWGKNNVHEICITFFNISRISLMSENTVQEIRSIKIWTLSGVKTVYRMATSLFAKSNCNRTLKINLIKTDHQFQRIVYWC